MMHPFWSQSRLWNICHSHKLPRTDRRGPVDESVDVVEFRGIIPANVFGIVDKFETSGKTVT